MKSQRLYRLLPVPFVILFACSGDSTHDDAAATTVDSGSSDRVLPSDGGPVADGAVPDAVRPPDAGSTDIAGPSDGMSDGAVDGALKDATGFDVAVSSPDLAPPEPDLAQTDVQPPTTNLPAPWHHIDLGTVAIPGLSHYSAGVYTVTGSGGDIWNASDDFTFVYQSLSGDGEITGRLVGLERTSDWAKAGLMFRAALTPTSQNVILLGSADHGTSLQWRPTDAVTTQATQGNFLAPPRWFRLVRSGKVFLGFFSSDGLTWQFMTRVEVEMPHDIFVGMAVASQTNSVACTGIFENIAITKYPPYPASGLDAGVSPPDGPSAVDGGAADADPGLAISAPWTAGDIGQVGLPGAAGAREGAYILSGSGSDIWGTVDAFTYVFQEITGDAVITAHLVSVEAVDNWTKAGVMVRTSLEPGASHSMVVGTPGNGVHWQYRAEADGSSTDIGASYLTHPIWLRVERVGSTVINSLSVDGTTWLEVGRLDLAFTTKAYIGLVTTAHNNGLVARSVFDQVVVTKSPGPADAGTALDAAGD